MAKTKVAVLISGRGSNLQSLIDACAAEDYPAEIAAVISNRPQAAGLERARKAGIPTHTLDHRTFGTKEQKYDDGREAFEEALNKILEDIDIEYICLAGFMRLFTKGFVRQWHGKLINIHPSLLPAFKGLNVHERMLTAGVKLAGCTVHFVNAETDGGPIIGQTAIPVLPDDDADSLAARILVHEHRLYPACLRALVENKARLTTGGIVRHDASLTNMDGSLSVPYIAN